MVSDSSIPRRHRNVHLALMMLGILAAMVAASTIGYIAYEYVTRQELREPPPLEEEHTALPSLFLTI